ncbi:MAG: hypothetical protein JO352_02860 [Chloroflexi bacterium]|nr:hypothetical protein [Chloroflexota bacterium]MBV9596068.1 hypothetical protein [Chloroflexota bacterium]
MSDRVRLRAWRRWQAAAGPWRGWAMCPALTMPDDGGGSSALTMPDDGSVPSAPTTAGDSGAGAHLGSPADFGSRKHALPGVEAALVGGSTAIVADLDPLVGIHLAATLSRDHLAHVVLVLPRWPHAEAVLPTAALTAALIDSSRHLRTPGHAAQHVVFVLDGERSRSVRRAEHDPRVDNRYDLAVGDLPNLQQLRAAGIQRIVKLAPA